MIRGPLYGEGYPPQLSGHETFPLRYGWLKKAFDAVSGAERPEERRAIFSTDDAIARFGVGKNMVASMRHWATAADVIRDDRESQSIEPTALGRLLFDESGGPRPVHGVTDHFVGYSLERVGEGVQNHVVLGIQSLPRARIRARHARARGG